MQLQTATSETDLLFVYGTLMSSYEGQYALFLRKHARLLGQASTKGRLYTIAWYPGLVKGDDSIVWGELYKVVESHGFWHALDEYEGVDSSTLKGDEYEREIIEVDLQGKKLSAWTYIYTGMVHGDPIPTGRFM